MNIKEWPVVKRFFSEPTKEGEGVAVNNHSLSIVQDWGKDASYKNYALNVCIGRIVNALALCDFQTYEKKKMVRKENWWLFNYEPNRNQNKVDFLYDIVYRMIYNYEDGALIVQSDDGQLIVAEDFTIDRRSYQSTIYKNILLPGGYTIDRSYKEEDVFHFKLNNGEVKKIIDSIYEDYGKLIAGTIRNYNRGNAFKLKLLIDAAFEQFKTKAIEHEDGTVTTEYDEILDEMFTDRYKAIFSDKDSLTPFETGLSVEKIETTHGNTKSGAVTTRDITSTFEDVLHQAADALSIPRGIIKGDVADNEGLNRKFIDDAIRPIAMIFQVEINRKYYGKKRVLGGTKLKVQTNVIYTHDPVAFANAAEAYLRIGVYSPNDILLKLGEEPIDEPWANEYYVTKNYQQAKEAEKEVKAAVKKLMGAMKFEGRWDDEK
ncbi:phage portal protein [Enterococcus sp. BWM-S5]|uniref:Phage portal protein n=1 Tax=Enterococcus larvae TaxID=2794352 RepID=A0ABS4CH43_9ENTE|nr:phage portal protein [Enterococcus larvae]MBP1045277.1 phage portal protein [Enterococcus larvae]